jgi:mannose-6-phosphate isomerase-like protein (cupin superfamily)
VTDVGHWDAAAQGPLTESSLRDWLASQGYTVCRYDYPPGTHFPMHRHDVDKIDAVLGGCFRIEMDGTRVDLGPGM